MDSVDKKIQDKLISSGVFDARWYAEKYPDFEVSGLKPIEHFLTVGLLLDRQPGPECSAQRANDLIKPLARAFKLGRKKSWRKTVLHILSNREVMLSAKAFADHGQLGKAGEFARRHLGNNINRSLELFAANEMASRNLQDSWLRHLNNYLAPFEMAPISLKPGSNLIERLSTDPVKKIRGGPLVSVIMPAHNASDYIEGATRSILAQSWTNLELLIVDDASTDDTWSKIKRLESEDCRVKAKRNTRNVGPYVSKNIALLEAKGQYITGQDADDWSHPQRIERHLSAIQKCPGAPKAGTVMMLRLSPEGRFDDVIASSTHHSPDGIRRRAFISCMFERNTLIEHLGFYDSVRFGADGEMLGRAQKSLGTKYRDFDEFGMLCLNAPGSLTNHGKFGLKTDQGVSQVRKSYVAAYEGWHGRYWKRGLKLDFPLDRRPFAAPSEMIVPEEVVREVISRPHV